MICYLCRQLGHVRWDCLKIQGSQDFGTAQSQLAVEQESIQFIPPHSSMDQRNQFSLEVLYKHLRQYRWARGAIVWVEVRYRTHRP